MKKLMNAVALAAAVSALTSGQQAFSEDYQQALLTHHPVVVTFDKCNGNIGTIKCGEQYFLQYPGAPATTPKGNMCEANCGVNALKNPPPYQPSGGYCNANPETVTDIGHGTTWSIDVFGRILYYNTGRGVEPEPDVEGDHHLGNNLLAAGCQGLGERHCICASARWRTVLCGCSPRLPRTGAARRQACINVRFPNACRPTAGVCRRDDLHRRSDRHDPSINSGVDTFSFSDPRRANRCRPDDRHVSRA